MSGFFITSTGTEIGKTFITASLCYQLRKAGSSVHAIKPLISGIDEDDMQGTDTAIIADALGIELDSTTLDQISPFRYKAPLAPAMAAELEGKTLDYDEMLSFCRTTLENNPNCLVEGVGGSFVPLTKDKLVANWIADLRLPSIVVAGSYLGTLSHITATLEAMAARGLPVLALIVSESAGNDHPNFDATLEQARNWTNVPVFGVKRINGEKPWLNTLDLLPLVNEVLSD